MRFYMTILEGRSFILYVSQENPSIRATPMRAIPIARIFFVSASL